MQMEMYMKEIGQTIKLMVEDFMNILMVQNILVIGSKIDNMVTELKLGQTTLGTKETMKKVKSMV